MTERDGLRLELPARAESVAEVRRAASEFGRGLGMADSEIIDLAAALSEACANVVKYAYGDGQDGSLEVELIPADETLQVFVRDRGGGIRPQAESAVPSLKLGLAMIGALSRRFRLTSELGCGTELEIELSLSQGD